jgi:hypothetical protein
MPQSIRRLEVASFTKRHYMTVSTTGSTTFHNIQCVVIYQNDSLELSYAALTEGAPRLSVSMEPRAMKDVLSNFPSLQQIVMRRKSREQVSEVRDGQVFATESGMLLRGRADWSPNL